MGSTGDGPVTANVQPTSRPRSSEVPVNVIAGWIASGIAPAARAGCSTSVPSAPAVCTTIWPGLPGADVGQARARGRRSASSGTVSRTSSARSTTCGTVEHRHAGQQRRDALAARLGDAARADDGVPGGAQGAAEHGAHAPGPDDADAEPARRCRAHDPGPRRAGRRPTARSGGGCAGRGAAVRRARAGRPSTARGPPTARARGPACACSGSSSPATAASRWGTTGRPGRAWSAARRGQAQPPLQRTLPQPERLRALVRDDDERPRRTARPREQRAVGDRGSRCAATPRGPATGPARAGQEAVARRRSPLSAASSSGARVRDAEVRQHQPQREQRLAAVADGQQHGLRLVAGLWPRSRRR